MDENTKRNLDIMNARANEYREKYPNGPDDEELDDLLDIEDDVPSTPDEQEQPDELVNTYIDDDMTKSALAAFYRRKRIFDVETHNRKLTIGKNFTVGNYVTVSNQLFDVWLYDFDFTAIERKIVLYAWRQSKGFNYRSFSIKKRKSDKPYFADTFSTMAKKLHIHRDSAYRCVENLVTKNVLKKYEHKGTTYYQINIFYDTYDRSTFHPGVDIVAVAQKEIETLTDTMNRWHKPKEKLARAI